jgi:hypothetical protein
MKASSALDMAGINQAAAVVRIPTPIGPLIRIHILSARQQHSIKRWIGKSFLQMAHL